MPKGVYTRGEWSKHSNCRGDEQRQFWRRVNKDGLIHPICGQCWIWIGSRIRGGYGQFKGRKAHRLSYTYSTGQIPDGLLVMHKCDNPPCVNPDHLFIGTPQDNMDDKVAKGRQGKSGTKTPPHGDLNGRAKLTKEQVLIARQKKQKGWTFGRISRFIHSPVHRGTLAAAISGKTWRTL